MEFPRFFIVPPSLAVFIFPSAPIIVSDADVLLGFVSDAPPFSPLFVTT